MNKSSTDLRDVIIEPDLDERDLDGYYFQTYTCNNCRLPWHGVLSTVDVMILKGKPRPKQLKCPNCELETLV